MKLHIFNPEHDMALAANLERFTAPHAGREMRADLGFLPALWADNGDLVLVDDVEAAQEAVRHVRKFAHDVVFVTTRDLKALARDFSDVEVEPWGWDRSLKGQLLRAADSMRMFLPDDARLDRIRTMSSRRFAADNLLPVLRDCGISDMVGESVYCQSADEVNAALAVYAGGVLKSPWSSSGRGVRYVRTSALDGHSAGWVGNVLRQQGGIMVEPIYPKVYDFGMEFYAGEYGIDYCGLSLFDTRSGAYTGSVCATENDKLQMMSRFFTAERLFDVSSTIINILEPLMEGTYTGPFGVDMMVVAAFGGGFMLHPCVELNLRRTMGHVALAVSPNEYEPRRIMSVYYADKYRIRIQNLTDNLINTGLC